ncbi:PREDICTED: uncharacterized protein LOC109158503 [Ipomoea nil]|uniref:uncharacterized protein LOC109158503 n=1 Tax=Ipomoea nil TaxID=35883 RepID=UPI000901F842|nr:PREDICTED: uncharacterized protein LOC109158503 [Ipomoea nil]
MLPEVEPEEPIPDEISDDENDDPLCPTIRLTKKEVEEIRASRRKTLIIKVMGRSVGYAYLLRRHVTMWKPKGSMDLIAIDNDYFLVRFGLVDDLEFAMFEGPWMVLDHYLLVKQWVPDFDPFSNQTEKVLVWVRIPCLPVEYYNIIFLRKLGNKVGRSIRVDQATSLVSRGKFARICVEVDITKPLISKFNYKGKVRHVAYEGIHMICFACGIYGHAPDACPRASKTVPAQEQATEGEARKQATTAVKSTGNPTVVVGAKPFGSWMIAPRRKGGRPQARQTHRSAAEENRRSGGALASRFAPLAHETGEDGVAPPDHADDIHENGEGEEREEGRSRRQATISDNSRRPNVITSEKQIENEPMRISTATTKEGATSTSKSRRPTGSTSRRAAEEDEHIVVRGEKGGLVINSTRVYVADAAGDVPSLVWQSTNEHHSDPPEQHDDEGDVVMDLEALPEGEENEGSGRAR